MFAEMFGEIGQHTTADIDYQARVEQQIAQYSAAEIHDVPPIHAYWSDTHIRPRLNSVMGVDTVLDFYVEHIRQRAVQAPHQVPRILSIGAGDAELEIQIAQRLVATGLTVFRLDCLELSPILIERANDRIHEAGLAGHVAMVRSDLNSWSHAGSLGDAFTAVIANHILHHIVELELLFDNVSAAIGDTGVFLTADMIGRNGPCAGPRRLGW